MLGIGFAVSKFCPGTGLTAAATGHKNAMVFVVGGLVGAAAYMASYSWVASTGILEPILGGKTTLATISGTNYPALFEQMSGEWLGIFVGIVFVVVSLVLPTRLIAENR